MLNITETVKYINNRGEEVSLCPGDDGTGIWLNASDLHDYEWNYDSDTTVSNFRHDTTTRSLPCVIIGADEKACKKIRSAAYKVFERDIIDGKKGKLYVNDNYLACWIYSASNTDYMTNGKKLNTTWKLVSDNFKWVNEHLLPYHKDTIDESYGLDYKYDYPYDYQSSVGNLYQVNNECDFECDFRLAIHGPVTDPTITIAGHKYKVNGTVTSTEDLIIDSRDKSVTLVDTYDGATDNWINARDKTQSVFQKIPAGISSLYWSNDYSFDLTLFEMRSEPEWS